jgi:hypothetical protein
MVELVREQPPGLEVGLEVALEALDQALSLGVGRLAELPVDGKLAAERRIDLHRAPGAGVEGALAVPHQQLRQRAERPQATAHTPQHVGRPL